MQPLKPYSANCTPNPYPTAVIEALTKSAFDVEFQKFTDYPPEWVEPVAKKLKVIYERVCVDFNSTGFFKYNFPYKTFNICFKSDNGFTLILKKALPLELELKIFLSSGLSLSETPVDNSSKILDYSNEENQSSESIDPSITAFQLY